MTSFDVDGLAQDQFEGAEEGSFDELPGSPEFVKRAMRSDLKHPIVVIRYQSGDVVVDGNHRLWKARELGLATINGYLIYPEDLEQITPL